MAFEEEEVKRRQAILRKGAGHLSVNFIKRVIFQDTLKRGKEKLLATLSFDDSGRNLLQRHAQMGLNLNT